MKCGWMVLVGVLSLVPAMPASARPVVADDTLAAVRDLYAAAAYEDALSLLDLLRQGEPNPDNSRSIELYRASCLLALGRNIDAEHALAMVVTNAPMYRPADADLSPRVRSAYSDVRRRMLPGIVQDRYAQGKAHFDHREFDSAAARFGEVLSMLSDPDLSAAAGQPPLADLRTLAAGFEQLSVTASAPAMPPAPQPDAPAPAPAAAVAQAPPAPVQAVARIYGPGDPGVEPPVPLRQQLPRLPNQRITAEVTLEIVVDERGSVEETRVVSASNTVYDRVAQAAARAWRYKPAMVGGTPVKYKRQIHISLKPAAE